jgi:hypothetical protein
MPRKILLPLLVSALTLPVLAICQKKSQPENKLVSDTAGLKVQQREAAAAQKKAGRKPATASPAPTLSPSDTVFLALVKDLMGLRAKYEALIGTINDSKKPSVAKADTFGFLSLHEKPPFKAQLFLNGKPFLDKSKLNEKLPKDPSKSDTETKKDTYLAVPDEALVKSLDIDSVQVYLKNIYITRTVIFSKKSVYQSFNRVSLSEIDDPSTFINLRIDNEIKEIRVNSLFVYAPWHDDNDKNVKEGIYVLSASGKITLPTQD